MLRLAPLLSVSMPQLLLPGVFVVVVTILDSVADAEARPNDSVTVEPSPCDEIINPQPYSAATDILEKIKFVDMKYTKLYMIF